jgi:hypothetical protein
VTLAKIANASANSKLLGSGSAGSGAAYSELTLGTNLSMSSTTLNASGLVLPNTCAGRLTLTTLTPITTTDVSGATTVYFTPYLGNHVSLYTASVWTDYSFAEINIALGTLTSAKNYDVFAYDSSGVTLKIGPAWSSDTSRGTGAGTTELTLQDGIYVNANSITSGPGALAGRYLGTFRTTSTTATEDSASKRFLFNMQNRTTRSMVNATETADSWNYSTPASYRQANANTANQLDYVDGIGTVLIEAQVNAYHSASNASANPVNGIGLDSTTTNSAQNLWGNQQAGTGATSIMSASARYIGTPGLGRHFLAWLEAPRVATGTVTFYGDSGAATFVQSAILGIMVN